MTNSTFFPSDRPFVSPEVHDAFFAVTERLDAAIARETQLLARHDHSELAETARQKRQGLLELERLLRSLKGTIPSTGITTRLALFRETLAANQAALMIEFEATEAVAAIITRAMRELESDGTYSRSHGRATAYDLA